MKLRLKSHSVRFRVTVEEMDELTQTGRVGTQTIIPTCQGDTTAFRYEVIRDAGAGSSDLLVKPNGFSLVLCEPDWLELADEAKEGVYIRREWRDDKDRMQRCVIYVEKDRKKDKHKKHKHKDGDQVSASETPAEQLPESE